jgi:hypothetical protein
VAGKYFSNSALAGEVLWHIDIFFVIENINVLKFLKCLRLFVIKTIIFLFCLNSSITHDV